MTINPIIQEIIDAGPATEEASHAPKSYPEPIKPPNPSKTS